MRKTSYRQTREVAILALQQAQHAKLQGTLTSTREERVETFLLNWLYYQIQPKVRERFYQTYHQTVMQDLLPSLGQIALQKPAHWHIQRLYYQKRRQHKAPSTIHKIHRILRHALNDATKLGHVPHNVSQDVELPAERKRERATQALTIEQARQLLAAAQNDPLEALYVLALTTGMREARTPRIEMERSGSDLWQTPGSAHPYSGSWEQSDGGRTQITNLAPLYLTDPTGYRGARNATPRGNNSLAKTDAPPKEYQSGCFAIPVGSHCEQMAWFGNPFSHCLPRRSFLVSAFMTCATRRRHCC